MDTEDYNKWKVTELRAELTRRNLSIKGLKKDLIQRLTNAGPGNFKIETDNNEQQTPQINTHQKSQTSSNNEDTKDGDDIEKNSEDTKIQQDIQAIDSTKRKRDGDDQGNINDDGNVVHEDSEVVPKRIRDSDKDNAKINLEDVVGNSEIPIESKGQDVNGNDLKEQVQISQIPQQITMKTNELKRENNSTNENSNSQVISPKRKEDSETTKRKRQGEIPISSSNDPVSNSLYISNLLRPLTQLQVRKTFESFGKITNLWLDSIKSHAYVVFENVQDAQKAQQTLNGTKFPVDTGKIISIKFIPSDRVESLIDYEIEAQESGQKVELDVSSLTFKGGPPLGPKSHTQKRNFAPAPPSQFKVLNLDELFKKTQSKPSIYFKPVSENEAAKRLLSFKET